MAGHDDLLPIDAKAQANSAGLPSSQSIARRWAPAFV
jgi:hypothetical protein